MWCVKDQKMGGEERGEEDQRGVQQLEMRCGSRVKGRREEKEERISGGGGDGEKNSRVRLSDGDHFGTAECIQPSSLTMGESRARSKRWQISKAATGQRRVESSRVKGRGREGGTHRHRQRRRDNGQTNRQTGTAGTQTRGEQQQLL